MGTKAFVKDPSSILDYEFDWTAWLTDGETITSHDVTVTGVTLDETTASNTAVVAWVSGGTVNTTATIACEITTSAARVDERTITLRVLNR
jgi:hypothetical protein